MGLLKVFRARVPNFTAGRIIALILTLTKQFAPQGFGFKKGDLKQSLWFQMVTRVV